MQKASKAVERVCDRITELVMTEGMTVDELRYFYQEIEAYCGLKLDETQREWKEAGGG